MKSFKVTQKLGMFYISMFFLLPSCLRTQLRKRNCEVETQLWALWPFGSRNATSEVETQPQNQESSVAFQKISFGFRRVRRPRIAFLKMHPGARKPCCICFELVLSPEWNTFFKDKYIFIGSLIYIIVNLQTLRIYNIVIITLLIYN